MLLYTCSFAFLDSLLLETSKYLQGTVEIRHLRVAPRSCSATNRDGCSFPPSDMGAGGSDKRAKRHILMADRLQATAAGNTAAVQRLLLQQMDQRCAARSKCGTLNNSATHPVTLTAV